MSRQVSGPEIIGFLLALVSGVLLGTSVGTHYWFEVSIAHYGMFQACVGSFCVDFGWDSSVPTTIWVLRGISLFACLATVNGYVMALIDFCGPEKTIRGGASMILAGVITLTNGGCFTGLTYLRDLDGSTTQNVFGYSYYLCWAAGAIHLIAGVIMLNGNESAPLRVYPWSGQRRVFVWAISPD